MKRNNKQRSAGSYKTIFMATALSIITCLSYGIIISYIIFTEDLLSFWVQIPMVAQFGKFFSESDCLLL